MPLTRSISYTTTGTKDSLNMDPSIVPFNCSVACTLVAGTVSYKMQYSLSDMSISDANALWFDSIDIPAGTAGSAVSQLASPVERIRFIIASIATGPLTVQTCQGVSTN